MTAMFNLVCTNSLDGDHAMLQRWYADHIHLLMRFAGLNEARLFQRTDVVPGLTAASAAPHYTCLYTFADAEAFERFEVSDERANAGRIGRPEWMRTGLAIVLRQQYLRVALRERALAGSGSVGSLRFEAFRLVTQQPDLTGRWLAGALHRTLQAPGVTGVQLYQRARAPDAAQEYLAVTAVDGPGAGSAGDAGSLCAAGEDDGFGAAPDSQTILWQHTYRPAGHWQR